MSKQQLIDEICRRNRSATRSFLEQFDFAALETYLCRLTHLAGRRGRDTVWVRPNPLIAAEDTPRTAA